MSRIEGDAGPVLVGVLGGLAAIDLTIAWGGFWAGLALSTLWGWFIVPIFGLPVLGILQAYGVGMVLRTAQGFHTKKEEGSAFMRLVFIPPIATAFLCMVGWFVKTWM